VRADLENTLYRVQLTSAWAGAGVGGSCVEGAAGLGVGLVGVVATGLAPPSAAGAPPPSAAASRCRRRRRSSSSALHADLAEMLENLVGASAVTNTLAVMGGSPCVCVCDVGCVERVTRAHCCVNARPWTLLWSLGQPACLRTAVQTQWPTQPRPNPNPTPSRRKPQIVP